MLGLAEDAEAQFEHPEEQQLAVSDAVIEACLAVFEECGADISQVNPESNARDAALLADALGYDEFNLFGISYGTRLALEVMRQAPNGLRCVVIDSVSTPDVPGYAEDGIPFDEATRQLFVMCAEDEACAAAYPDLQDRFSELLDRLDDAPIGLEETSIDADAVFEVLESRNGQRGLTAYMPQLIAELQQGVVDTYQAIATDHDRILRNDHLADRRYHALPDYIFSIRAAASPNVLTASIDPSEDPDDQDPRPSPRLRTRPRRDARVQRRRLGPGRHGRGGRADPPR